MEQVEEEALALVAEVDRLQRKHPSYIQTSAAALPPSSAAVPPSSPLAPPGASFLVPVEPIIFSSQCYNAMQKYVKINER